MSQAVAASPSSPDSPATVESLTPLDALHNIGNVLNGINASLSLLERCLPEAGGASPPDRLPAAWLPRGDHLQRREELRRQQLGRQELTRQELKRMRENLGHAARILSRCRPAVRSAAAGCELPDRLEPWPDISIDDLIEQAIYSAEAGLEQSGVRLHRPQPLQLRAALDADAVLQILINLILNARQALAESEDPQVFVDVQVVRRGKQPAILSIAVTDNGKGIPRSELQAIFERGRSGRGGQGIGLHFASQTARRLGGELQAISLGTARGATFLLALPCRLAGDRG